MALGSSTTSSCCIVSSKQRFVHVGAAIQQHSLQVIKDLGVHGRGHDISVADTVLAMLLFQVIL